MKRVCNACGAEYPDHAEYCNACGSEDLRVEAEAEDMPGGEASIRDDGQALWMGGGLWLIGLGYSLTVQRPRDAFDLFLSWLLLSALTFVLGLSMRGLRSIMIFPLIGAPFLVAYWYIKLVR